jgi:hypothetical protein
MWWLSDAWKEIDMVCIKFCNKLMMLLSCSAYGYVEMELCRERRNGKAMGLTDMDSGLCICTLKNW